MLQIGKILKSNGTEGGLLVSFLNFSPEELNLEEPVFIIFDELSVPFFIQSLNLKSNTKAIIRLNDVNNLIDAEEIVGRALYIEGEWEEDSEEDFTDWKLYDKGEYVGVVDGMEWFPSNPCLCIGEILIPLNEDFIIDINPNDKILNLDIPKGLING